MDIYSLIALIALAACISILSFLINDMEKSIILAMMGMVCWGAAATGIIKFDIPYAVVRENIVENIVVGNYVERGVIEYAGSAPLALLFMLFLIIMAIWVVRKALVGFGEMIR